MNCENSLINIISKNIEKRMEEIAQRIVDASSNTNGDSVPIGAVIGFMELQAPEGYLELNGAEYSITDYQNLAAYFQNKLGSINYFGGNGITTFAVPDARGEFIRGYDSSNCKDPEGTLRGIGKHQDATKHINLLIGTTNNIVSASDNAMMEVKNHDKTYSNNSSGSFFIPAGITSMLVNDYYTSRPTNINLLYCIKY